MNLLTAVEVDGPDGKSDAKIISGLERMGFRLAREATWPS